MFLFFFFLILVFKGFVAVIVVVLSINVVVLWAEQGAFNPQLPPTNMYVFMLKSKCIRLLMVKRVTTDLKGSPF